MKGIELPIFYHTTETMQLQDMDIEVSENAFIKKNVTFYEIIAIAEPNDGDTGCKIYSNGDYFQCALGYNEVNKRVVKWRKEYYYLL